MLIENGSLPPDSRPLMLTLDTLARMADRMPTEMSGTSGAPPFRVPDAECRLREVALPTVAEEAGRAARIFAFVVSVAVLTFSSVGVLVGHADELLAGHIPTSGALLSTALWYAGWTAMLIVPFAALGLVRELLRFHRVRQTVGDSAWLDARGWLHSESGRVALRPR
ncbi:MAG: hypothetical protein AB8I08_21380 [Sandaracinaceae bacterium]